MCEADERRNMVELLRKCGRTRAVLSVLATVVAIMTGMWVLTANVSATIEGEMDNKIKVHRLESETEWQEKLNEIKIEQSHQRGQLNEILRRLPE